MRTTENTAVRLNAWTEPAKEITVDLDGDTEKYAQSFLAIFNNVKEFPELIRVTNGYDNQVYVVCAPDAEEEAREWLSHFGEIKMVDDILLFRVEEPEYDYDKYGDAAIIFE